MTQRKPIVTITSVKGQDRDRRYWKKQPYLARLTALEQIRQEYHRWKYHAEPRLQRVYSTAQW